MEDSYHLELNLAGRSWLYCGIYDGHGGAHAATYAAEHLNVCFLRQIASGTTPPDAFRACYEQTARQLESQDSGTTAVDIFIRDSDIFAANAGDSRAVIVNRSGITRLTVDHRLDDRSERERILRAGAEISYPYVMRDGQGLMTTRSLGDQHFAPSGVISTPFTSQHTLSKDDLVLISASDGLWDVLSSEEVGRVARRYPDPDDLLSVLKDDILNNKLGGDNLTIIAVSLTSSTH